MTSVHLTSLLNHFSHNFYTKKFSIKEDLSDTQFSTDNAIIKQNNTYLFHEKIIQISDFI